MAKSSFFSQSNGIYTELPPQPGSDPSVGNAPAKSSFFSNGVYYTDAGTIADAYAAVLALAAAAAASEAAAELAETNAEAAEVNAETAQAAAELAETNAEAAQAAAEAAQVSAEAAQASAETAATNAATSATAAAGSATAAAGSATAADASADSAFSSASDAATSASDAASAAVAAAASYDAFDDRYLGDKAADPALDNDGNALLTGALYWNTTADEMRVWNGTTWEVLAPVESVFGRIGVVAAQAGDYVAAQVTNVPAGSIAATDVQAAINELDSEKAASVHTHAIADVTGLQAALDGKSDTTHSHRLDALSDVSVAAPNDGDVLTYDNVSGAWVAEAPTGGSGGLADTGIDSTLNTASGLVVKYVTAATVDVDASRLVLFDTSGNGKVFPSVNLTADITASGANGLDTGSEASSTWYYIWVVGKSDGTVAALLSTSATAPTLPATYTYQGRVGAVRNDSSSNLVQFIQRGRSVTTGEDFTISRVLTNGAATTFTSVDLSAIVPPIATAVDFSAEPSTSSGTAAVTVIITPFGSGTTTSYGQTRTIHPSQGTIASDIPAGTIILETAQTVYYRVSGTNARASLRVKGYSL